MRGVCGRAEGRSCDPGGGRLGGKEREGPRDQGGGGWLGSSRRGSSRPLARSLTQSLPVLAARRPAPGCSRPPAPAWRSGQARAPEDKTARLASRALGRPREQVGGSVGTARTRSLGRRGHQGTRGWGFQPWGGDFAAPRLTFHQLRGPPAALPRSGLPKPSLARGGGGCWWLRESQGVRQDVRRLSVGRRSPPAAVGMQCPRRLHVRGKTREQRRGAGVPGRAPVCPLESGDSAVKPPRVCRLHSLHGRLPRRGRDAEPAGMQQVFAGGRPCASRPPSPSRCHARFCFWEKRGGTCIPLFLSHPVAVTLFREVQDLGGLVGWLPGQSSCPRLRPWLPKLKEKQVTLCARLERGPEVPNFSLSRGR